MKRKNDRTAESSIYYYNAVMKRVLRAEWQNKKTTYGKQPFTVR